MPDLGKYALTVLTAYGASILLIVALAGLSLWQANRMKHRLDAIESRSRDRVS